MTGFKRRFMWYGYKPYFRVDSGELEMINKVFPPHISFCDMP
jgi:hypothetical protein